MSTLLRHVTMVILFTSIQCERIEIYRDCMQAFENIVYVAQQKKASGG
jgi:hypothetical protein